MRGVLGADIITCVFTELVSRGSDPSSISKVTQVTIVGSIVQVSIPNLGSGESLTPLCNIVTLHLVYYN